MATKMSWDEIDCRIQKNYEDRESLGYGEEEDAWGEETDVDVRDFCENESACISDEMEYLSINEDGEFDWEQLYGCMAFMCKLWLKEIDQDDIVGSLRSMSELKYNDIDWDNKESFPKTERYCDSYYVTQQNVIEHHLQEWIAFWWENQTDTYGDDMEEWTDPFELAEIWWENREGMDCGDSLNMSTVLYSAGVYADKIMRPEIEQKRFNQPWDGTVKDTCSEFFAKHNIDWKEIADRRPVD